MSETTRQLVRLRCDEQKKPITPWRRQLLNALELAICVSDLAEPARISNGTGTTAITTKRTAR